MFCFYCAEPILSTLSPDWFECSNGHRYAAEFIAVLDTIGEPQSSGIPEIVMEAYGTVGEP